VSLSLPRGRALGLLGSNWAGKTTFLTGVAGQARLQSGTVSWNGQRVHRGEAVSHCRARRHADRLFPHLRGHRAGERRRADSPPRHCGLPRRHGGRAAARRYELGRAGAAVVQGAADIAGMWRDADRTTALVSAECRPELAEAFHTLGAARRPATLRDLYFAYRDRS